MLLQPALGAAEDVILWQTLLLLSGIQKYSSTQLLQVKLEAPRTEILRRLIFKCRTRVYRRRKWKQNDEDLDHSEQWWLHI